MAETKSFTTGIEWNINKGEVAGDEALEPTPNPDSATGFNNPVEFQWEDATARLIGGPEQLVDFWIQGRPFVDVRTIVTDDESGEVTSDSVTRFYPAYVLKEHTLLTSMQNDWVDDSNPAKPRQFGGPVLYSNPEIYLDPPVDMLGGGYARVGIHSHNATFQGFVADKTRLPEVAQNQESFLVDLEEGRGYIWTDSLPGALEPGARWTPVGRTILPHLINTDALGSVDELNQDAEVGTWQVVNTGVYGTVYAKTDEGWLNIGPIQLGGTAPFVVIDPEVDKSYISGYYYGLVFDQSDFRYVPRMSGETQNTYEGEVHISETGWFPDAPHDVERDIYPMDTITKVKPDGRETVSITYTSGLTCDINFADPTTGAALAQTVGGTVTVIQDVYQPTYNWGSLIAQLLELTYFKHGIYH